MVNFLFEKLVIFVCLSLCVIELSYVCVYAVASAYLYRYICVYIGMYLYIYLRCLLVGRSGTKEESVIREECTRIYIWVCVCMCVYIFANPSARAGYDKVIFKRSLTGLNSEFSFS